MTQCSSTLIPLTQSACDFEGQHPTGLNKEKSTISTTHSDSETSSQPQDLAVNIQKLLAKNRQLRSLYLKDKQSRLSKDFLSGKTVNSKMRTKLVKWLQTLSKSLKFKLDTFFMTVAILDHYLWLELVTTKQLQLVGATCLYISSKLYETNIKAPEVYVFSASGAFTKEELLEKEKDILHRLNFKTDFPDVHHFLKLLRNTEHLSSAQFDECLKLLTFLSQNDEYYYEHAGLELAELVIQLVKKNSEQIRQGITYEKLNQEFRKYTL